jgi:ribosome-associated protein
MPEPILAATGVVVPAAAIRMSVSRASGPGGQNVNKVSSKVELRIDLGAITGLSDGARARLESLAAPRLDAEGHLVVVSQRTRDQHRNLEDARDKVRVLIERSLVAPRKRRATRPSAASRERRLTEKRRRRERKAGRSRPRGDD